MPEIERFVVEHSNHGIAVTDDVPITDLGPRLFDLGAYLGEPSGTVSAEPGKPTTKTRTAR
ncbi:hypothetical protein NFX46_18235 [Streptomyces phaeoluteigriseus]|uniref:Uncharacterized protein n=1 Tax=Streptomyces phaeoluteigriseus TaxID=114686 RepID=A0ABY4Z9A1_9ACTN|nr:hypothetical protein [Streptomyces phaeoluteigriseus]USQ85541.1 hypothetical protein NFX46_18235 [Streptomyces phaeoluteigriseus]